MGAQAGPLAQQFRVVTLVAALAVGSLFSGWADQARGSRGAVATVNALATDAGMAALKRGGNAVDAAIAAALTLGLADGHNSGIGGGCFMLIRLPDGSVVALDGRETAPAAATREMFVRNGHADPGLSQTGALAVGVPGALAAYAAAAERFGKLPFADHLRAAAEVAERGFPIDAHYAARLKATAPDLRLFPSSRAIFLHSDGSPLREGEILKQLDLAQSYRAIADQGIRWFYEGPFAKATAQWMGTNNGLVTKTDFSSYQVKWREPIRTTYRGYEIIGFPPPSSGGVHVAQILNLLEGYDLRSYELNSPKYIRLVTECMKLAFADRAHWLGDPDFTDVPRGLLSKTYANELARNLGGERALPVNSFHTPPEAATDRFGKHTTHFSAADGGGTWVACTATINTSFGSKVVVPGTGVLLNNQMDDFSSQAGAPNVFGLIGGDANAVAPGKRPLSSMSPTLVLKQGQPILALGAAGGPTIISQVLLTLVQMLDFDLTSGEALDQPRFHHQWRPDVLRIERGLAGAIRRDLRRRGYRIEVERVIGSTQIVAKTPNGRTFVAASDPRGGGKAGAW